MSPEQSATLIGLRFQRAGHVMFMVPMPAIGERPIIAALRHLSPVANVPAYQDTDSAAGFAGVLGSSPIALMRPGKPSPF